VDAVTKLIQRRVVPAAIELADRASLDAQRTFAGSAQALAPPGTGAALIIEVDGSAAALEEDIALVERACADAGATEIHRASNEDERQELWRLRRELSLALKEISSIKLNNDVVVPRGRVPQLFELVDRIREKYGLPIASFGHAGDGNIHVNIMVPEAVPGALSVAKEAVRELFEGVVALEGSISGEHGIGFTKAPYLHLELSAVEIALMKRLKAAFDPHGILNPGKIFPDGPD
jgi:glycolate oxidase